MLSAQNEAAERVATAPSAMALSKLGQPQPASNLVSDVNKGLSQQMQT